MAEEHVRGRMPLESNPGKRNPAIPPVYDTTGKEDYRRVTPDNPLPTKDKDLDERLTAIENKLDSVIENGAINTQLTGSYVEYERFDVSNKNELNPGEYEKMDTLADSGEIAEIVHYSLRSLPPSNYGATEGTHRIIVSFFNDGSWNRLLDVNVAYSSKIEITRGMCHNAEAIPSEKSIQIALSMGLIIDDKTPFRIMYMNNSNATVPVGHIESNVFLLKEGSE